MLSLAGSLDEEEQRGLREELSEEELAVFDLLTKPDMQLTKAEEAEVKKAARQLLETLKRERLVLDWRKRQQTRSAVRVSTEQLLDELLPRSYTPEIYLISSRLRQGRH